MAREKFDNGLTNAPGTPYTLDSPASWGGNSGTYINTAGPNGTVSKQQLSNPITDDVNRYRDRGAASAGRAAYQLNYGDADADHAQANAAGALQGDANSILQGQADGTDHVTSDFQRNMLQKGAQNQQAGALSSSGGALAQMAAMQRVNAGAAGYMQRGNAAIAGQQANDMASGRAALATGTAAQRKGDMTGQMLNDQQSQMQASSETAQRALDQNDQMHNEGMAVDTEAQGLSAAQHSAATAKQREQAQYDKNRADDARAIGYVNQAVGAIPVVGHAVAAGGSAAQSATTNQGDPNDPDNTSDERAKRKLSPNALVSLMRKADAMKAGVDAQRAQLQSSVGKSELRDEPAQDEGGQSLRHEPNESKKPLLLDTDTEMSSQSLPSDEILENWRLAHKDPEKEQHAPGPESYDRSMFAKQDDGTAPGDADTLYSGIEKAHARDIGTDQPLPETRGTMAQQRQGYYATRRGQVGDVLGGGPKATYDLQFGKGSNHDRGMAPGTGDAVEHGGMDYGGHKDASWGVQYGGKVEKDGFNRAQKMDAYSEAVSTSDARAKEHVEPERVEKEAPITGTVRRQPAEPEKDQGNDANIQGARKERPVPESPATHNTRVVKENVTHNAKVLRQTVMPKLTSGASPLGAADPTLLAKAGAGGEKLADALGNMPGNTATALGHPELADKANRIGAISDERAKNKGYASDKGAGGGESESDGTVTEHGGGALVEMQKHANRMLAGEPYRYKEGFGEDTSQVHHGFMAQNLEQNPITATAVREDGTGIKKVNNLDALRVTAAGVASLQDQHDELESAVAALAGRRKKRVA